MLLPHQHTLAAPDINSVRLYYERDMECMLRMMWAAVGDGEIAVDAKTICSLGKLLSRAVQLGKFEKRQKTLW
jgi:hypothetical protein